MCHQKFATADPHKWAWALCMPEGNTWPYTWWLLTAFCKSCSIAELPINTRYLYSFLETIIGSSLLSGIIFIMSDKDHGMTMGAAFSNKCTRKGSPHLNKRVIDCSTYTVVIMQNRCSANVKVQNWSADTHFCWLTWKTICRILVTARSICLVVLTVFFFFSRN